MKLLVIIPMYNAETFIDKCLQSIISQDINMRIIVVDDCSTDSSYRLVANNPKVEVLRNTSNIGTYLSINRGLYYASGDSTWTHYTIHGADDISLPGRFKSQFSLFNSSIKAVGCRFDRVDWVSGKHFATNPNTNESVLIFDRLVFNTIGYYNASRVGSDTDYKIRFRYAFKQPQIPSSSNVLIHSYLHSTNITKLVPLNGTVRNQFVSNMKVIHEKMKSANSFYLDSNGVYL
jgi:glycosyltransferase involved in cell wall biosynthesis